MLQIVLLCEVKEGGGDIIQTRRSSSAGFTLVQRLRYWSNLNSSIKQSGGFGKIIIKQSGGFGKF